MNGRGLLVCSATVAWLLLVSVAGQCGNEQLTVVQDESSMERIIEHYLVDNHKLIVNAKTAQDDANDLYLELPFDASDPVPEFRLTIDSQPLNRDANDQIIERGLLFNLYTAVKVPEDKRAAAMVVLNDWNRRKAFASVYIDTDGEVVCSWIINVLAQGLPTEYTYDVVARLVKIWQGVYPAVAAAIKG